MTDEVDPLDAFMAGIEAEVEQLVGVDGKKSENFSTTSRPDEEEEGAVSEEDQINDETLKNLSVEDFIA
jgi:hypothetical protein